MTMLLLSFAAAATLQAPAPNHATMDHSMMDHGASCAAAAISGSVSLDPKEGLDPKEPGQSAYAALSEVVQILIADPATDWSKVDIDMLRRHLVDMDNVTLHSTATTTKLDNGARFSVIGDADVAQSIQRMTKSHFAAPDVGTGWKMVSEPSANGAVITVTSAKPEEAQKIAALGFYGILSMGAHHQPHHLMMARGAMRH